MQTEKYVGDNVGEKIRHLAGIVALGGRGDFPLFGDVREEVKNVLDSLVEAGVLRQGSGTYLELSLSEPLVQKSLDLVDGEGQLLYFTRREHLDSFASAIGRRYPSARLSYRIAGREQEEQKP